MQTNKKIVVTGGGGFLASHLANKLIGDGAEVLCISRKIPPLPRRNPNCIHEVADLRDSAKIAQVMTSFNPDTVYHLASRPDDRESFVHAHSSVEDNLSGTINLLEAFRACDRSEVFVYADSVKVYGNALPPYSRESLPAPNSSYAISKLAGWHFCELFSRNNRFNVVSVRPTLIYGYLQSANLIHFIITSILEQRSEITLMGGDQTRSPLYIADAVDAYIRATEVAKTENMKTMLISGKTEMKVIDIALLIADILDSPIKIAKSEKEQRETEITRSYVELKETYEEFGWQPKYSFVEGLKETIRQYAEERISESTTATLAV